MTEQEFKEALAEFTTKTPEQLEFSDDLAELGVDSIGVFEFCMKVEDAIDAPLQITESVKTVHDLFDCVVEASSGQLV